MASPPFDILELKPGDADLISAHPADERTFRDIVESWILVDHDTSGLHNKVQLPERADPTLVANVGILYSKDVGGVSELHYIDSAGSVKQITSAGKLLIASADLPNGVVLTAALAAGAVDGTKLAMGSDAQGDVLFYGGAAYKRLAPGTSGQFLQTLGAGADPAWATVVGVVAGTDLVKDPVATSSSTTQAHGLSAEPDYIKVVLECKTAEDNYSIGDRILLFGGYTSSITSVASLGETILIDATNVQLVIGVSPLQYIDKTGFGGAQLTDANWKLILTPYTLT